jgi:short-subunit dehydrogenase
VRACRFSESIAEALKGKIRVMTIFPAMVVTEMTKCAAAVGCQCHVQCMLVPECSRCALWPSRVIQLLHAIGPRG